MVLWEGWFCLLREISQCQMFGLSQVLRDGEFADICDGLRSRLLLNIVQGVGQSLTVKNYLSNV